MFKEKPPIKETGSDYPKTDQQARHLLYRQSVTEEKLKGTEKKDRQDAVDTASSILEDSDNDTLKKAA
jgi:hypothetical protein